METLLELLRDETIHPLERIGLAIRLAESIEAEQDAFCGLAPTRRTIIGDLHRAKVDAEQIGETLLARAIAGVVQDAKGLGQPPWSFAAESCRN